MSNEQNIMGLSMNINQEYIKQSVEDIVKAAIIQALGDPSEIVKKAVDHTINKKVNDKGEESTYYNAKPYLNWLAEKTVKQTVANCVTEYVTDHSEEFKAEVMRLLNSKKFKHDTAEAFVLSVIDCANSSWRMPVTVSFEHPKEY